MGLEPKGQNLIFLISQPRAGSTMLQRILGTHPDIYTTSEPWLMLHPFYAMRSGGYQAEYDEHLARLALDNFLRTLPQSKEEYFEGVRRMYCFLYGRALVTSNRGYFLDKTPRYYFIIPELIQTFPDAHFIFLLRNPLAVLCSIIQTWAKGNLLSLHRWNADLVRAPGSLLNGIELSGDRGMVVHYEQFVADSGQEAQRICSWLNIPFLSDIIDYGRKPVTPWLHGDQEQVYEHIRPAQENVTSWVNALKDPQIWRLVNDYLNLLGKETVERMGYPFENLQDILQENQRTASRVFGFTFSLQWLFAKAEQDRGRIVAYLFRLNTSLQRRGALKTMQAIFRKIIPVDLKDSLTSSGSGKSS